MRRRECPLMGSHLVLFSPSLFIVFQDVVPDIILGVNEQLFGVPLLLSALDPHHKQQDHACEDTHTCTKKCQMCDNNQLETSISIWNASHHGNTQNPELLRQNPVNSTPFFLPPPTTSPSQKMFANQQGQWGVIRKTHFSHYFDVYQYLGSTLGL